MTPKEKAEELIGRFDLPSGLMSVERKQCALIAVDEIQEAVRYLDDDSEDYWYEVKNEIKKL